MGKKVDRGGTSALRDRTKSPTSKREKAFYGEDNSDIFDSSSMGDLSKEISHYLS